MEAMSTTTVMLMAGAAALVLFMLAAAFSGPSPAKAYKRRMEMIKERHGENLLAANANAQIRKLFAQRQSRVDSWASTLMPRPALLRRRLEQTGKPWTLAQYGLATVGIVTVVAGLLLLKGMPAALAVLLAVFVGVGVPHMAIGFLIKRRVAAFNANFPDAIELMVRGLRSGLPITETLGIVATELSGPVGVEFRAVADRMKIGRTMDAALQETAERLGTPEFQFFVITLNIQRETGGNLAETLSNLADVLRKRAQMKLKIKAMSSESKASAYIVGSLPFIVFTMVYMMNPEYMAGFFSDDRLMVAGLGGLLWMGIGVFIMAKMVNFEI
jgi:tight adherence protein B